MSTIRRFYAAKDKFGDRNVFLDQTETRHLRDVLRLRRGEQVNVFDGEGREFLCEITSISKTASELKLIREVSPSAPESILSLTLAVALTKGAKFDLIVQKLVELGVARLCPIITHRCGERLSDAQRKFSRWNVIALQAAKQSGRSTLMQIEGPMEVADFLNIRPGSDESRILFSERGGSDSTTIMPAKRITSVIGPEGGWDDSEIREAKRAGFKLVTLGGRILRAETAAMTVAAIIQHRFGDLR